MAESGWDVVGERVAAAARLADELGHARRPFTPVQPPPLPEVEVAALESWLGIRLPSEYRSYVVEVANGGIGPRGRLLPIERDKANGWRLGWGWTGRVDPATVRRPFPAERMDHDARLLRCGPPPFEEAFTDLDRFQHAFDEWAGRANAGVLAPERTAGAIPIMDRPWRDEVIWLIVTGPARGQIWLDPRDGTGEEDMSPLTSRADGQPLTFRSWYLEWLDDIQRHAASL